MGIGGKSPLPHSAAYESLRELGDPLSRSHNLIPLLSDPCVLSVQVLVVGSVDLDIYRELQFYLWIDSSVFAAITR